MRVTSVLIVTIALLAACAGTMQGHISAVRPAILDHPGVVRLDPNGDGSQVAQFLQDHAERRTAGICQGRLSEESTPSDWCVITESGSAYLVADYTQDPQGIAGYRISPLQHKGGNRFYSTESRQEILLLPWSPPNNSFKPKPLRGSA